MSDPPSSSQTLPQNPPPPASNHHHHHHPHPHPYPHSQQQQQQQQDGQDEAAAERGYAIELYFDPALENQILKAWNVLARRQISSRLISISSRPHITLLSSPSLDPARLHPLLRSLAPSLSPLPITLSSVGAFPDRSSLFLSPLPTAALLSLHSALCDALRLDPLPHPFRVDSWLPHVLVADDVPRARMAEAFCILKDLRLPVSGYAVDLGLVEFSPVREVFSFPLGAPADASTNDA